MKQLGYLNQQKLYTTENFIRYYTGTYHMPIWGGGGGPNTPQKISKFFNLYICSKITKNIYRSAYA